MARLIILFFSLISVISSISGIRYSELEVFLYGLDLGSLVSIFHQQQVDFTLLLTLGEEDLDKVRLSLLPFSYKFSSQS